ncbi:hypothetical protein Tco_0654112 [Tanacetum coccineum]|uniref:Uncharacterized protein n=1 Tax=Tanacetum coccineum TaxID=301880 RepID=A0ABQ4X2N2_9ASTR
MQIARGDDVAIIKRRRQDLHRNGVRDLAMASGCGQLKEDLESSMWRWDTTKPAAQPVNDMWTTSIVIKHYYTSDLMLRKFPTENFRSKYAMGL